MKSEDLKILLLVVSLSALPGTVFAQSDTNTIFRFLDVTPTASASALGGNHTGLYSGDYAGFHINPAYLFGAETGSVSATFVNQLVDSKMGFTNGAVKLNENNYAGIGIRFVGYGDFETIDERGNELGDFNATDIAISGVYAAKLIKGWNGGVGIDLVYSSYEQYKSSAVAISGGVYYKNTERHFSFGAAIRHLGTQLSTYNGIREPMPLDVSVGITKKPAGFPAEVSITLRRLNNWDMKIVGESGKPDFFDNAFRHIILGGMFDLSENFRFRMGYNRYLHELNKTKENFDFAGVGFGVGFHVRNFIIDISRNSYSETGAVVQLSIKTTLQK